MAGRSGYAVDRQTSIRGTPMMQLTDSMRHYLKAAYSVSISNGDTVRICDIAVTLFLWWRRLQSLKIFL